MSILNLSNITSFDGRVTAQTTLVVNGNDTTVTLLATNTQGVPSQPVGFSIPAFFSKTPSGTIGSPQGSQACRAIITPCLTLDDGTKGFSVYQTGATAALDIAYLWALAGSSSNTPAPSHVIQLFTGVIIPANATYTYTFVFRQTTNLTPAGLLSGFKGTLSPIEYTAKKSVPKLQSVVYSTELVDGQPVPPTSFGRDLTSAAGVQTHLQLIIPHAQKNGCDTIIYWGIGGPEYQMFPVAAGDNAARIGLNFPALYAGLKRANIKMGLAIRTGNVLDDPSVGGSYHIFDPSVPADVAFVTKQINIALAMGFTSFYDDSVIGTSANSFSYLNNNLASVQLLRTLGGPEIDIFVETPIFGTLALGGMYCEWDGSKTIWLSEQMRSQWQYLRPSTISVCVDRSGTLQTTADYNAHGLTPLYPDTN
jgi:hypothetical protein